MADKPTDSKGTPTLRGFFAANPRVALAFSGGVDSSYLLWAAAHYGADVTAYYVRTPFQPVFELEDARQVAELAGARMKVLDFDVLTDAQVAANPFDRCYYCKQNIFSRIGQAARADGYSLLMDGTNASDDASDRPGMRALRELGVRSPLRECGLTKAEIRRRSRAAGLPTWGKPAYACLATRVAAGEAITAEKLATTERAETFLHDLGLRDFRVRMAGGVAKLQVRAADLSLVMERREEILHELGPLYQAVTLDLATRPDSAAAESTLPATPDSVSECPTSTIPRGAVS